MTVCHASVVSCKYVTFFKPRRPHVPTSSVLVQASLDLSAFGFEGGLTYLRRLHLKFAKHTSAMWFTSD